MSVMPSTPFYGLGVDTATGMVFDNHMNNTERPTRTIRAERVTFGDNIYEAGDTRTAAEIWNDYTPGNGRSGSTCIVWIDGSRDWYPADYRLTLVEQ